MINLLCFLCSLCIQFVAVGITPFDYSIWDNTGSPVYSGLEFLESLTNLDLSQFYYAYFSDGNGYGYCYVPLNYFSDGYDDISISYDNYIVDDNNDVIGYRVTMSNVRSYTWESNGTYRYNDYVSPSVSIIDVYFRGYQPPNYNGWLVERLNVDYMPYMVNNVVFVYNGIIPDHDSLNLPSIGVLDSSGHSSGNPFEFLINSSISWGSMTGHSSGGPIAPSPHSSSTHFSSSTPSPDSNDSKTDSLLYMIGNKLADITENTGAIGNALGGVLNNQIHAASAIYNGISGLNENIVNFVNYVTEPFDSERFNSAFESSNMGLATSKMRDLHSTIEVNANSIISGLLTTQVNELVIPIDFTDWEFRTEYGTLQPFDQIYYMRFGFLDETRNIWQPLLLGLCYLSFAIFIIFDFPNLLRGSVNAAVS